MKSQIIRIVFSVMFACIASCKKDTVVSPPPPPQGITVHGFVKDIALIPINAATVIIKGKGPVQTLSDGSFTIQDATPPYDIYFVLSSRNAAYVYVGVTRSDPTLLYLDNYYRNPQTASITGSVPGMASDTRTKVFFASPEHSWGANANSGGGYGFSPNWFETSPSFTGKLYLLRWTASSSGVPLQYTGFAVKDSSLTISRTGSYSYNFTAAEIGTPGSGTIAGQVQVPSGYTLNNRKLYISVQNSEPLTLVSQTDNLSGSFSYAVPTTISSVGYSVEVTARQNLAGGDYLESFWYQSGISAGQSTQITMPPSPRLSIPSNGGRGVDTTFDFRWSAAAPGGIYNVVLYPLNQNPGPVFSIFTSGNTTRLPNLYLQGLSFPPNTQYGWYVREYSPATIEQGVSPTILQYVLHNAGGFGYGESEAFYFTTKTSGAQADSKPSPSPIYSDKRRMRN